MGAMRRFKRMSGKDVTEVGNEMDLISDFLYCCVVSACNADGKSFEMDVETFADCVDMNDIQQFLNALNASRAGIAEEAKKKTLQSK